MLTNICTVSCKRNTEIWNILLWVLYQITYKENCFPYKCLHQIQKLWKYFLPMKITAVVNSTRCRFSLLYLSLIKCPQMLWILSYNFKFLFAQNNKAVKEKLTHLNIIFNIQDALSQLTNHNTESVPQYVMIPMANVCIVKIFDTITLHTTYR